MSGFGQEHLQRVFEYFVLCIFCRFHVIHVLFIKKLFWTLLNIYTNRENNIINLYHPASTFINLWSISFCLYFHSLFSFKIILKHILDIILFICNYLLFNWYIVNDCYQANGFQRQLVCFLNTAWFEVLRHYSHSF